MSNPFNPFAQLGDYRESSQNQQNDVVTTSYLTGLPDPRQIPDERVALIFRQLMKRDTRTKLRALQDLLMWVENVNSPQSLSETIVMSYVQMYAKLSNDLSPQIRLLSQTILGNLFTVLGKRSSKFLKFAVGPWLVSQFDSDLPIAERAQESVQSLFPGEKYNLLITKLKSPLVDFIYDSCAVASAQSMSDERYATKEEAARKYSRLVKCCIDLLIDRNDVFDLEMEKINELVETGILWKYFSSSDPSLARSALKLAQANVDEFERYLTVLWKELLRACRKKVKGAAVAVEILQFMNVLTKKYPQAIWPEDESYRKDSILSISQYIYTDPLHPTKFWPLLYNLALIIPEPPARDLTPMFKPLEKVAMKVRFNPPLEDSIWGCFVSLANNMGLEYAEKTFNTAEKRSRESSVPVDSIAKYLARIDAPGINDVVKSQLLNSTPPLDYILILAKTKKFGSLIEEIVLPKAEVQDLAMILEADPNLTVPSTLTLSADANWLRVAAISDRANAGRIVSSLVAHNMELDVLQFAGKLKDVGISVSLDQYVLDNLTNLSVLEAAVGAVGVFVNDKTAVEALRRLLESYFESTDAEKACLRVIKAHPQFIKTAANSEESVKNLLQQISQDDDQHILHRIVQLDIKDKLQSRTDDSRFLDDLQLDELDLSVPAEAAINNLRAVPPLTKKPVADGIAFCEQIVENFEAFLEGVSAEDIEELLGTEGVVKLIVITEFVKSWSWVATPRKFQKFFEYSQHVDPITYAAELWSLVDSEKYETAFHAALALTNVPKISAGLDTVEFSRGLFSPPSLRGAILAYFSHFEGNVQYDNLQRSLVREALSLKLEAKEWMLIDRKFLAAAPGIDIKLESIDEYDAVFAVLTFKGLAQNSYSLISSTTNDVLECAALLSLDQVPMPNELLEFAANLPQDNGLRAIEASKCLSLVVGDPAFIERLVDPDADTLRALLERDDSAALNWIALHLMLRCEVASPSNLGLGNIETGHTSMVIKWIIFLNHDELHDTEISEFFNVFDWIGAQIKNVDASGLSLANTYMLSLPSTPPQDIGLLFLNVLFRFSLKFPNAVRSWYRDIRDKALSVKVGKIFSNEVSPAIIKLFAEEMNEATFNENVEVSVNEKQREIKAIRNVDDEFSIEIVLSLPDQYPGKPAAVNIRNLAGVSEAKKRGWLLETRQNVQNGSILTALQHLLMRLDNFLKGVEPCAICYMTVNDQNKLPNKECSQCHNIYHTDCLYKWFSTNGNKLCPMCRSPI